MASDAETLAVDEAATHGFSRPEMHSAPLAGTVNHYEKHVFLCYKGPQSWPPQIETSQADDLPRLLAAAIKSRKSDFPKKTRLTICEAWDESCEGDVLILPDMIKYKSLGVTDIESFVDDVLVNEKVWQVSEPEKLSGSHIFVCAHAKRDQRCGYCGPVLIETFKKEISSRGLSDSIFVRACSHIGGHKYAGNVIVYSPDANGQVAGHWYGYVTPDDTVLLLDEHISKGKIIANLWRGQMGLDEEQQKDAHSQRLENASRGENAGCYCEQVKEQDNKMSADSGCCQEKSGAKKCKDSKEKSGCCSFLKRTFSCFDSWEKEDTLAALAVVGAVAAVAFAFSLSRKST